MALVDRSARGAAASADSADSSRTSSALRFLLSSFFSSVELLVATTEARQYLDRLGDSQSGRAISFFLIVTSASGISSASPNDNKAVFLTVSTSQDYIRSTHFLAFARFSRFSASLFASMRASSCARFSAAVIRGTMSGKGFSMIRIPRILGGLSVSLTPYNLPTHTSGRSSPSTSRLLMFNTSAC